jgi:hypothetical protein
MWRDYQNISRSIAIVTADGMATLDELDTVYGSQDLADMVEIISINAHNQRLLAPQKP